MKASTCQKENKRYQKDVENKEREKKSKVKIWRIKESFEC